MICQYCNTKVPPNREICPNNDCYRPIKTIPVPPGGKARFGGYDWYVLEKLEGKILILTEKVIEKRVYHRREGEITWETCDMRKYLNGEFYNSFGTSDRKRIIEVVNENTHNPWYGTHGGNPTIDKIFLLSIDEVLKYFGDSGSLKNRYPVADDEDYSKWCKDEYLPWIDDQYSINRRAVDDAGMVVGWSLRSPGANGRLVASVSGNCGDEFDHGVLGVAGGGGDMVDGHFIFDTVDVLHVTKNINGVRPALWLRTD